MIRRYVLEVLFLLFVIGVNAQKVSSCYPNEEIEPQKIPSVKNVWIFIMAGQSNMAGRGVVEPQDTIADSRILSLNKEGKLVVAKEPLHRYEPSMMGLDCGMSFAHCLLKSVPDSVSILMVPTAVGGSSIKQWLGDLVHRDVQLFSNFKSKVEIAKHYGTIKAILWHQGESDATDKGIASRQKNMKELFGRFRATVGNDSLPILIGELGSYSKYPEKWLCMNEQIRLYSKTDKHTVVIPTSDFKHKGDQLHFNSEGERTLGRRFALKCMDMQHIGRPTVVLSFDDAVISHYEYVAPLLKKYEFGGTFFVCEFPRKSPEDSVKYMTWSQIAELNKMGFEIGNHTRTHKHVNRMKREDMEHELGYIETKCKEYAIPKPVSFAYPGYDTDSLSHVVLREMGYKFGRTGGSKMYDITSGDPLLLPSFSTTGKDEKAFNRVMGVLQSAEKGKVVVFTIHGVPDTAHPNVTTAPEYFVQYLEYMYENNFRVISMRDIENRF